MSAMTDCLHLAASDIEPTAEFARWCDANDPLATFRDEFHIPAGPDGRPVAYMVGNSLGLQPKAVRTLVTEELDDWARLGVEGHVHARRPWVSYHELFRDGLSMLAGALPHEVVAMNTLTVNLHLMMASFWQPSGRRRRILIEKGAFPSDTYAVRSHVAARGMDPDSVIVEVAPRADEACLRDDDICDAIAREGDALALVMLGGVNYYTGQVLDMARITRAARDAGARCGWDLAHAIGNVEVRLHEWDADFACWCSYKYLNGGPGAVAGVFIHERHATDFSIPRMAGWWSHEPSKRFEMRPELVLAEGADGWAVSNPPILSLTPLLASFDIFRRAGLERLRAKARAMTAYIEMCLRNGAADRLHVLTPASSGARGAQLSIEVDGGTTAARSLFERLAPAGVLCDFRHPSVIRAAPAPLYCSFADCRRLVDVLLA
jgi:kynureninase